MRSRRFQEHVVLIAGAASGIGRATAAAFAAEGAHLAIADIDGDRTIRAAAELEQEGVSALPLTGDLTDGYTVQHVVHQTVRHFDRLDALVNSAGVDFAAGIEDTTDDAWDRIMAVNVRATFLLCKYAIPVMLERSGGSIVNIASAAALHPVAGRPAYNASKGAVVALTRSLALDFAPRIRVNCVCPGAVDTPMLQTLFQHAADPSAVRASIIARYPLARLAEPAEIAQAVLFLTSADASFITGATLAVDGGRTLH